MEKKKVIPYQLLSLGLMIVVLLVVLQSNNEAVGQPKKAGETLSKQETMLSVIHSRKSVRSFVPQKAVSKEDLTTIVKAGMAAPSAVNKQPWAFVVITERAMLDALAVGSPNAKMLNDAGAAIVVCGDLSKAHESAPDFWVQDCSAASENILLAVEGMGLGAVWTGVYPSKERVAFIRQTLSLPEHIVPLNLIPIGYPQGETQPKDKWKEENLHWNKW